MAAQIFRTPGSGPVKGSDYAEDNSGPGWLSLRLSAHGVYGIEERTWRCLGRAHFWNFRALIFEDSRVKTLFWGYLGLGGISSMHGNNALDERPV